MPASKPAAKRRVKVDPDSPLAQVFTSLRGGKRFAGEIATDTGLAFDDVERLVSQLRQHGALTVGLDGELTLARKAA